MQDLKFETLLVDVRDNVAFVTINRADTLNALNRQVLNELKAFCAEAMQQKWHAVVLAGAGEKAFVAGADISEMRTMTPSEAYDFAQLGQSVTTAFEALPQLTIARVQGFALGGGCEIAMACDVVLASENAKFGQPEVGLGLIAGFGGTQRLVRRVGLPVAMDMLGAGRILDGNEAFQTGLISRVCKAEDLDAELNKTLKRLAKLSPAAITASKRLVRDADTMSLSSGLAAEASAFATRFCHPDAAEGMGAFLEKRSAKFVR